MLKELKGKTWVQRLPLFCKYCYMKMRHVTMPERHLFFIPALHPYTSKLLTWVHALSCACHLLGPHGDQSDELNQTLNPTC